MAYFCNYVAKIPKVEGLAVEHATTPELADQLTDRLGALYPREKIVQSTVSPVIGESSLLVPSKVASVAPMSAPTVSLVIGE